MFKENHHPQTPAQNGSSKANEFSFSKFFSNFTDKKETSDKFLLVSAHLHHLSKEEVQQVMPHFPVKHKGHQVLKKHLETFNNG